MPEPEINVIVNGREVDVLFREQRVIVELDGGLHMNAESFESDRDREAENLKHGFRTVRITQERFEHAPGRDAARLHAILSDR